ncbi:hypothetical protein [Methylobacterium sp. Leaf117]|uniref:hypothetical protein n=1 Tax=Methylobacterium sp. Leaf117 TaxID=1736260 RepID=UPI0006F6D9AB|nr:hypothetical protein [Methylobacterium sp. Leaf117]KQP91942.1 hypothetical protein ASF57_05530 [Methylobacterium sp. Leaf117]
MTKEAASKNLKDHIRWPLWGTIAANLVAFHGFSHYEAVTVLGTKGLLASITSLVPMGFGLGVTTVANGFLSADMKARLVFLRRVYALPGHRAFSAFAVSDPRVDADALRRRFGKTWPTEPMAENRAWFKLFKETESDPAVLHLHREFLFTRDFAGLAAIFLVMFGAAAAFTVHPPSVLGLYIGFLVLQFWLARHAAATYGNRLVSTVLARIAATAPKSAADRNRTRKPQLA